MSIKAVGGWLAVLTVGVTSSFALIGDGDGDSPADALEGPSTQQEKFAARVAVDFVARLRTAVCGVLVAEQARRFRCAGEPRIPAAFRSLQGSGKSDVYDLTAVRHGGVATPVIRVEDASGKKRAVAIEVDAAGRVVAVEFFGYA